MEKFYLERPGPGRKTEIIGYLQEFKEAGSDVNGSGSLDRILSGWTFEQALERCLRMEEKEYALKEGRCPGKTFLMIRRGDQRIIGTINVRWDLNDAMLLFGGHIGYGIRPSERGRGYSKILLYLGLKKALALGLTRVMIGCSASNTPSDKTIRALGGELERCGTDPEDGQLSNVYRIDVRKSLKTCSSLYEPYICQEAFPDPVNDQ